MNCEKCQDLVSKLIDGSLNRRITRCSRRTGRVSRMRDVRNDTVRDCWLLPGASRGV